MWIRLIAALAAVLALILLFVIGTMPSAGGLNFPPPWDKLVHLMFYSGLAIMFWITLGGHPRRGNLGAIALVSLFGALDETVQIFTPGRTASVADWGADFIGALLAVLVLSRLRVWLMQRHPTMMAPFA